MKRLAAAATLMLGWAVVMGARAESQVRSITLPPDNPMSELKPGPGVDTVRADCTVCHSTDYIVRQPRSDAKRWEGEVKKMIGTYGASISDEDVKTVVAYLAAAYGPPESKDLKEKAAAKSAAQAH